MQRISEHPKNQSQNQPHLTIGEAVNSIVSSITVVDDTGTTPIKTAPPARNIANKTAIPNTAPSADSKAVVIHTAKTPEKKTYNSIQEYINASSGIKIFDDEDDDLETFTKYELSLAEFPVFFLSTKIPKDAESINYKDTINVNKQPVERQWQVTWNKKYGPPTKSVSETFFALYQIWAESGFESPWIHFKSIHAILKRKGLTRNQERYKQIIKDLNCLSNIFIEAKNAFYDTTEKKYVDMHFHLFEDIVLSKNNSKSPDGKSKGFIRASKLLFAAAKNNSFNFGVPEEIFFKLPSLQQRLCLYLKKMFLVYEDYHARNIYDLADQIPLYCTPRSAKHQIKTAAQALINAKIIPSFSKVYFEKDVIYFERTATKQLELFESDSDRTRAMQEKTTEQNSRAEYNYQLITELCTDTDRSERYYRMIAARMSTDDICRAISETRAYSHECKRSVNIHRVFVSRIKAIAKEHDISLKAATKKKQKNQNVQE
jgi:hypothetical protein